jgi:hypothetical protein
MRSINKTRWIIFFTFFVALSGLLLSYVTLSQASDRPSAVSPELIAEGGRLYDKWWAELEMRKKTSSNFRLNCIFRGNLTALAKTERREENEVA